MQWKKTITPTQIHYNVEITKSKTERETTNMITAQVKEIKGLKRRSSFLLQREKYTRQNLAELWRPTKSEKENKKTLKNLQMRPVEKQPGGSSLHSPFITAIGYIEKTVN